MQLRDDFAKHISELHNPIERPYSKGIDKKLLESTEDIEHLNKEIANVNPDYLTFLPAYFWVFYFVVGWVYLSSHFFVATFIGDIFYKDLFQGGVSWGWIFYFRIFFLIALFLISCTPLVLLLYQLIRKNFIRTQYYFLKKEQKIA